MKPIIILLGVVCLLLAAGGHHRPFVAMAVLFGLACAVEFVRTP